MVVYIKPNNLCQLLILLILSLPILSACEKKGQLNKEDIIIDLVYDTVTALPNNLFLAKNSREETYDSFIIDINGKVIYEAKSAEIEESPIFFKGKYYYIINRDGKKGLIAEDGSEIYPAIFDKNQIIDFHTFLSSESNIVPFAKTVYDSSVGDKVRKWGYLDRTNGEIVIEPSYYKAFPFHNGIAKVVVKSTSEHETDWGADTFTFEEDEYMYLFIDEIGQVIGQAPQKNKNINCDNGFLPQVATSETRESYSSLFDEYLTYNYVTYVFVDRNGRVLNNREFLDTTGFYNGYAYVRYENENTWSIIDEKGNITPTDIIVEGNELVFDDETGYYKLLASGDGYVNQAFYNERGEIINQLDVLRANKTKFEEFEEFKKWREYSYYKIQDGQTIFYDMVNDIEVILPPKFKMTDIYQYDHDYLYASKKERCYLIDLNGQEVYQTECKDQKLVGYIKDIPIFGKEGVLTYKNLNGEKIKYSFDSADSIGDGRFIVSKDGKMGVISLKVD